MKRILMHTLRPRELSRELRHGKGGYLPHRRGIIVLSLLSLGCMGFISLYQMGIVRHLPDPPLPGMDADKVDASDEAYGHFQMGDAFLGTISYSVTAALAAAGGKDRARYQRLLPIALAAKAAFDTVQAGRLTYDQFAKHRAACFWCLVAAASTVASLFLAAPEAEAAVAKE